MDNFSSDFIIKCECFEDLMQERMVWIEDGGVEKKKVSLIFIIKLQKELYIIVYLIIWVYNYY